jgi:GDPmannose 4,6-dehydratase
VRDRIDEVEADLLDVDALEALVRSRRPAEIYNLASPTSVLRSWEQPLEIAQLGAVGTTALLEAARRVDETIRICHASSSEVFGEPAEVPQTEATPLAPVTPYGVAKAAGQLIVAAYRRRYGMHAGSAILYNHESPRRPTSFLPSKVAHGVKAIAAGAAHELVLGDLEARRDWGFAPDYVEAMWLMLRRDEPGDYVVATGELHSVRELAEVAFAHVGLEWQDHVRVDESLKRGAAQAQTYSTVGDASKARAELGWAPSVGFVELVHLLVDAA